MEYEEYEDFECKSCKKIVQNRGRYFRYCPFCGIEQNVAPEKPIKLENETETIVYEWLAKTLKIDDWLVSETVKNQMATVFLLIWPILETKIFNNDMSHTQIKNISDELKEKIDNNNLDAIAKHFYERYQDKNKYERLVSGHPWSKIEGILEKPYHKIYKENKISFMIFVVYRYRNNIFHGIKSIKEWGNFSEEIQLCIKFMVMLGNCMDEEE